MPSRLSSVASYIVVIMFVVHIKYRFLEEEIFDLAIVN
jgi:hypothetical protein